MVHRLSSPDRDVDLCTRSSLACSTGWSYVVQTTFDKTQGQLARVHVPVRDPHGCIYLAIWFSRRVAGRSAAESLHNLMAQS